MKENVVRNELDNGFRNMDENDCQKNKYLTFHVGAEDYGIEIRHVTEIIGIQKITLVPDLPEFIMGVINLRGQVIPVMDVRCRFRMPAREYDERTCIIVVQVSGRAIGLVVDQVNEVADITEAQIEPPPQVRTTCDDSYLQGMGKLGEEVKILLDIGRLLGNEASDLLEETAEA